MLGRVDTQRAYYVCPGQSPRDKELDVEGTEYSPGVRRMMAVVGSETSFDRDHEQLELLAGLEVIAKAVERHAESIGTDIARREHDKVGRAVQLESPQILGPGVPKFYIEIDGAQVPVVRF